MANSNRTLFVRVRDAQQQFRKDKIDYPTEGQLKRDKDLKPRRFQINIQGYDEIGRPVCPVYEVEDCKEIADAIHNNFRRDPRPDDDINRDPEGMIIPSLLVQIDPADVERFPKWTGHPIVDMSPDKVYHTVMTIRREQKKGDDILGEESAPYTIKKVMDSDKDPDGAKLWQLWETGLANAQRRKEEREKKAAA